MNSEPTYVFRNGHVYTVVDGQVTSAVKEADFGNEMGGHPIHEPIQMPPAPHEMGGHETCPDCGGRIDPTTGACPDCGYGHHTDIGGSHMPTHADLGDAGIMAHTVTTPNGLKGTVLGKTAGLWGDEVTVRFENGRIVKLPVSDRLTIEAKADTTQTVAQVVSKLRDELVNGGIPSTIEAEARTCMRVASDTEARELHEIINEARYVGRADHTTQDPDPEPFAPFRMEAVEQESIGHTSSSWLDQTMREITAEAEATNYDKLLGEGPEALVAEIDNAVLADQGAVRSIASNFIRSHTAAASGDVREQYEQAFINRVEACRREELTNRKQATRKEAAQQDDFSDLPDDVLFGL